MKRLLVLSGVLALMVVLQACSSGGGNNSGGRVSISVSPASANLQPGETHQFTAKIKGTANTAVSWKASDGHVNGAGNIVTYTAPSSPGSYTVTATSKADISKSASVSVTVSDSNIPVILASSLNPANLYAVELSVNGKDTLIGPIQTPEDDNPSISDTALCPDGNLYGVSFTALYEINPSTAQAAKVGDLRLYGCQFAGL